MFLAASKTIPLLLVYIIMLSAHTFDISFPCSNLFVNCSLSLCKWNKS